MAMDCLRQYPNHNLGFDIYRDARDDQMGACITQNRKTVAYCSRKLNSAQRNDTTMEKEHLSIICCLKEYHTMILGAKIDVNTDNRNLEFHNLNYHRVLIRRCFLEDYSPTFNYIPGPHNVVADAFSLLPRIIDNNVNNKSKQRHIKTL